KAFYVPIKNRLASTLIKAFEEKIKPHLLGGHISTLRLDNAREHHSKDFVDYFKNQGTKIIYGIPNKSSSGGIVERFNGNLKERLKMKPNTISNQDWIKYHGTIVEDYNNTFHDTSGQTPNRRFIDRFPETYPTFKMNTEQRKKLIESMPIHSYFRVGEKVLFQIPRVGRLNVDALKPYYEGLYTIRKITVPNKCFIIQHDIHKDIKKRADHDQLRKFKTPPKYLQNLAIFQELMMPYHPKHLNPNNDQIEKTSLKIANNTVNMLPTNTVTITTENKPERTEERPMWKIMELQKPNTDSDRESTESDSSLDGKTLTRTSTRSQSSMIKRKISLENKKKLLKKLEENRSKIEKPSKLKEKMEKLHEKADQLIGTSTGTESALEEAKEEHSGNSLNNLTDNQLKAMLSPDSLSDDHPFVSADRVSRRLEFEGHEGGWVDEQFKTVNVLPLRKKLIDKTLSKINKNKKGRRSTYTIKTHGMRTRLDLICYNLDMKLGYYENLPM
ncbi:unnamed protein product, partial [Rotaria magnacalcarata]